MHPVFTGLLRCRRWAFGADVQWAVPRWHHEPRGIGTVPGLPQRPVLERIERVVPLVSDHWRVLLPWRHCSASMPRWAVCRRGHAAAVVHGM